MKFAVIKTGGKQYKVAEGDSLLIEKISAKDGKAVFDKVLLLVDGEDVKVGQPFLEKVSVMANVIEDGKAKKKLVFKFKNKTRQTKKKGHRQPYTKVQITKISA